MKIFQTVLSMWLLAETLGQQNRRNLRDRRPKQPKDPSDLVFHESWSSRIVGGTNAAAGEYPYMVLGDLCGASLVAPDVVLSAAHCAGNFDETVRVGSIRDSSGGQVVRTLKSEEILHPNYNDRTFENDIMLIKLREEVSFTPVPINFNTNNPATNSNAVLTVIGFGDIRQGGPASSNLLKVDVNYINPDRCDQFYGGRGEIKEDIMLCAG